MADRPQSLDDLIRLSEDDPMQALLYLEGLITEEVDNEYTDLLPLLAQVYAKIALHPLREVRPVIRKSKGEITSLYDETQQPLIQMLQDLVSQAISTLGRFMARRRCDPAQLFTPDLHEAAALLEQFQPGAVQQTCGGTRLLYFLPERLEVHRDSGIDDLESLLPFLFPWIAIRTPVRSGVAVRREEAGNRAVVHIGLFRELSPFSADGSAHQPVAIASLWSDGAAEVKMQ